MCKVNGTATGAITLSLVDYHDFDIHSDSFVVQLDIIPRDHCQSESGRC